MLVITTFFSLNNINLLNTIDYKLLLGFLYLFSPHGTPAVFSQFLTSQFLCPVAPFPYNHQPIKNWLAYILISNKNCFLHVSAVYQVCNLHLVKLQFVFKQNVVKPNYRSMELGNEPFTGISIEKFAITEFGHLVKHLTSNDDRPLEMAYDCLTL